MPNVAKVAREGAQERLSTGSPAVGSALAGGSGSICGDRVGSMYSQALVSAPCRYELGCLPKVREEMPDRPRSKQAVKAPG
jgi:hypothetical protein